MNDPNHVSRIMVIPVFVAIGISFYAVLSKGQPDGIGSSIVLLFSIVAAGASWLISLFFAIWAAVTKKAGWKSTLLGVGVALPAAIGGFLLAFKIRFG